LEPANELTYEVVPDLSDNEDNFVGQTERGWLSGNNSWPASRPVNNLTVIDKVVLLLSMARSLAELHGYVGGVIVHDNLHPDQRMAVDQVASGKRRSVLNDNNNSMALDWDPEAARYCPFYAWYGDTFRSPEEYEGDLVDETSDMWAAGNLIYSTLTTLTGLWPFYNVSDSNNIRFLTRERSPALDPSYRLRSTSERAVANIGAACHKISPAERIDIFEVVRRLENLQLELQAAGEQSQFVV